MRSPEVILTMSNAPAKSDRIYRRLQQSLDRQAVGFPAVLNGADLRILKRLFAPDEARLALYLSCEGAPTDEVARRAAAEFSAAETRALLETMFRKGAIGWKERGGVSHWFVLPLVVGMYECQDGNPSQEFLADFDAYRGTIGFGVSFLAVKPSQMRTIPIHQSIPVDHAVATYDQIHALVDSSPGPFAVLPCICRRSQAMAGKPCKKTTRDETCLAFGDSARMVLQRARCREVTRDEVRAILERNEAEGLVLQPANTQQPDFVCSCCGCCCGMLGFQKQVPHPLDFWSSSYSAEISGELCSSCGTCVSRCQVGAVALSGPAGEARVDPRRCIGCGLCVPTCPTEAAHLVARTQVAIPPKDDDALRDEIMANKKGTLAKLEMVAKVVLKQKQ